MEKKTECEIVQDLLLGYIDDVLNPQSKKLVEKHLSECSNCQRKLEEMKSDIKENEDNQTKEIDYLKKIRRKSRMKSVIIALGIIFIICFGVYINKLIIVNSLINKGNESLQAENFYKERTEILSNDEAAVSKQYFKDGKSKSVLEIYSEDGAKIISTQYYTVDSEQVFTINEDEKKVTIETGEFAQIMNKEENLKNVPFIQSRQHIIAKLGTAFVMSINTDTYSMGREYYVLKNQFEANQRWEIWIDKETGLPLKEINREGVKSYFEGTNVVKEVRDNIQEYKYEFGTVTDEDVDVPDLSDYEVEYVDTQEIYNSNN